MTSLRDKWAQTTNLATTTKPSWYRISNSASAAEVYMYDEIGFFGVTASDFAHDLNGIAAPKIHLHINSPGGAASEGVAIFNALVSHPADITTYVDGWAASAASVVAMAGDRIYMREGSLLMIHEAQPGMIVGGKARDLRELADVLDKVTGSIADIYTSRRGGKREDWLTAMEAETWYTRDEAIKAGLADQEDADDNREPVATNQNFFNAVDFAAALKGAFS